MNSSVSLAERTALVEECSNVRHTRKSHFWKDEKVKFRFGGNGFASLGLGPRQDPVGPVHVVVDPVHLVALRGELKTPDTHVEGM